MKDLLTKHKVICAEFLEQNYDKVFSSYQRLLNSENYVTKRQSLKVWIYLAFVTFDSVLCMYVQLLGELLLDRHNFTTMNHYISNPDNLKLMMNLLRDPSRNIQFEAFHVFKVLHHAVEFCKSDATVYFTTYRCLLLTQLKQNRSWTYYLKTKINW